MSPAERDVLIVRYLDGAADAGEVAALNALLRSDPEARALLREASVQALAVADLAGGRALRSPRRTVRPSRWNSRVLSTVAAVLLAALLGFVAVVRSRAPVLTLVRAAGAVTWSPVGGLPRTELEAGTLLGPGTVLLEGAESFAEVSFSDGSSVTLTGDSEVSFPGGAEKRLFLRRGSITVDVPAPETRPLVLRTPAADVEVLGTCYSLTAGSARTTVAVGTGKARLRRLVDGASAEIPQGQVAVATLDATSPIESRPAPEPAARWSQTFERPPAAAWQGEWTAADETGPGRLKNVLDVSYRRKDGTVVPAHVVSVRDPAALTTVRPESVLRLRWRVRTPSAAPLVLLSVGHPDGRFAGNFQTILKPEASTPDGNGWRSSSVPISSLEGRYPEGARLPSAGRVTLVFIACYAPTAGLEVAEVALE